MVVWLQVRCPGVRGDGLLALLLRRPADGAATLDALGKELHRLMVTEGVDRRPDVGHLDEGTLYVWLELIGWPIREGAEAGHVGRTVTSMRSTLEAGRLLTKSQRDAWDRLVIHNRTDCVGMRRLCLLAAPSRQADRAGAADMLVAVRLAGEDDDLALTTGDRQRGAHGCQSLRV